MKVGGSTGVQTLRFAGVEQQEQYFQWLNRMPRYTKKRILHVDDVQKAEGESLRHIGLAVSYGLIDRGVNELNKHILKLLKLRKEAQRENKVDHLALVREQLADLRVGLDRMLTPERARYANRTAADKPTNWVDTALIFIQRHVVPRVKRWFGKKKPTAKATTEA